MDSRSSTSFGKIALWSGVVCLALALLPYQTTNTTTRVDSTVTTVRTTLGLPLSPLFVSDRTTTKTGPVAPAAAVAREESPVIQMATMTWSWRLNISSLSFLALVAGIVLLIFGLIRTRRGPRGEAVVPMAPPPALP
jgi:hypothetical protein